MNCYRIGCTKMATIKRRVTPVVRWVHRGQMLISKRKWIEIVDTVWEVFVILYTMYQQSRH